MPEATATQLSISDLQALLNSLDPDDVAQGLDRAALIQSLEGWMSLLGEIWLYPTPQIKGTQVVCARMFGGLKEDAPYSHIAALYLLLTFPQARAAMTIGPAQLTLRLNQLGPDLYSGAHMLRVRRDEAVVDISPPLPTQAALLKWASDRPLERIKDTHRLLSLFASLFLGQLPRLRSGLPEPLLSQLLPPLMAIGEGSVDVPLSSPSPSAARLHLRVEEFRLRHRSLGALEELHLTGEPSLEDMAALKELPKLRRLTVLDAISLEKTEMLPRHQLTHLSLRNVEGSPPPWVWDMPALEHLGWGGEHLEGLPAHPPWGLRVLQIRPNLWAALPKRWRDITAYLPLRWFCIRSVGGNKLESIRALAALSNLPLMEARRVIESAPSRVDCRRLHVPAPALRESLEMDGCVVELL